MALCSYFLCSASSSFNSSEEPLHRLFPGVCYFVAACSDVQGVLVAIRLSSHALMKLFTVAVCVQRMPQEENEVFSVGVS